MVPIGTAGTPLTCSYVLKGLQWIADVRAPNAFLNRASQVRILPRAHKTAG